MDHKPSLPDPPLPGSKPAKEGLALEVFAQRLAESGLMSAAECAAFRHGLPEASRPHTGEQLAQQLHRAGKITKFQAQAVYQGKTKGLVMGNYVILDKLGEGGMGQVYKARHKRMDRIVALKMLPPAATRSADAVKRFQREVKAAAKLSHPNIVTAYDADEERGMHFMVMEHVDGQDLGKIIKSGGPLPVDVAVDYITQAGKGLQYAHEQGIVHRDIKPNNLLLDQRGTVKILDMGLARLEGAVGGEDEGLTRSGQVMGTLDYMAPEQALDTKHADARSDIYSLGCTLFYLLTGQPVYPADTITKKIFAHAQQPIPSLHAARPEVSEALDAVYQRMLAKRPEERAQTMAEVLKALQACKTAVAVGVGRPSSPIPNPQSPIPSPATPTANLKRADIDTSSEQIVIPGLSPSEMAQSVMVPRLQTLRRPKRKPLLAKLDKRPKIGLFVGLGLLLAAVLFGVIISLRTKEGTLIVELSEPDVTVQVLSEEGKVEIERPGEKDKVTIAVDPGKHRLRVKKDGFEVFTQAFSMASGGRESIKAKLEKSPSAAPPPPKPTAATAAGVPSPSMPVRDGLVLCFSFDQEEADGRVTDSSPQQNHGRAVGARWTPQGRVGGAYEFSQDDNYITVPNHVSLNPGRITLAAWIRTSCRDGKWRRIFDKSWDQGYALSIAGDWKKNDWRGRAAFEAGGRSLHFNVTERVVADGEWRHVAAVFDGTSQRLYVDGRLQANATAWTGELLKNNYDLTIGCMRSNKMTAFGESFRGFIDEVMVFDRPLSHDEVLRLFNFATGTGADLSRSASSSPIPNPPSPIPSPAVAPSDATRLDKRNERAQIQALLITGDDMSVHNWRETSQVTRNLLIESGRFDVVIHENPSILESQDRLEEYDVVFFSMFNVNLPTINDKAKENLLNFVKGGKGFVVQHAASGSFADWPEFGRLCGRYWVPKISGHGPRGAFKVKIVNHDHPVTRELTDFETDDELYANLQGNEPIEVLATAYSNWSRKTEPVAFLRNHGNGRVFHHCFGHDRKALSNASVAKIIARGTQWAATGTVAVPGAPAGSPSSASDNVGKQAAGGAGPQPTPAIQATAVPPLSVVGIHYPRGTDVPAFAKLLAELGYAGAIAYAGGEARVEVNDISQIRNAFESNSLTLTAIYTVADLAPGKTLLAPGAREAIAKAKGSNAQVWLAISNDAHPISSSNGDKAAVQLVRTVADLARDSGLRVALYPHNRHWMARIQDALRVAEKAQRENVGVTFNLCHCLTVGDESQIESLLRTALPRLFAVTVNGADGNLSRLIYPLDQGRFDLGGFLKTVRDLGYRGPFAFQCAGIAGDQRTMLERSMRAWRGYWERLGGLPGGTAGSSSSASDSAAKPVTPINLLTDLAGRWESDAHEYIEFVVKGKSIVSGRAKKRDSAEAARIVRGAIESPRRATYEFRYDSTGATLNAIAEVEPDGTVTQKTKGDKGKAWGPGTKIRKVVSGALSTAPVEPGFKSLFDGTTLKGWEGDTRHYFVENGCLVSEFGPGFNKQPNCYLFTQRSYGNFVIRFDYKLSAGANSGLLVRAARTGNPAQEGFEVQILDDSSSTYSHLKPWHRNGAVWHIVAPRDGQPKAPGQWNEMEVSFAGRDLKVTLNGRVIVATNLDDAKDKLPEAKDHPGLRRPNGRIGLNGDFSSGRVEYRNIRVKEL